MSLGDIELSKGGKQPTFDDFLNQKFTIPSSIQVEAPTELENLSSMVQDLIDGIMGGILGSLEESSSKLSDISKVSKSHLETVKENSFSEEKLNKKLVDIHTTHYERITEIQEKRDRLIAGRTDKEKRRDKDKSAAKTAIDLDPKRGFFSKVLGKGMVDLRSSIADSLDFNVFGVSVADSFKPLGNLIDKIDPSTTQEKNQTRLDKINDEIKNIQLQQGLFENEEIEQRAVDRLSELEKEKRDIAKSDPKIAKQDQALIVEQQLELIKEQESKTKEYEKAMNQALKDGDKETAHQLERKAYISDEKSSNLKKGLDASGENQIVSEKSMDEIEDISKRLNNLLEDREDRGIDRDNETHVFREEQIKILKEQLRQAKENSKISQTEQQERSADKQEAEIAKKEERTWMEKLFSSLSGGESDIKPEKEKGGFWGFLALTGAAIGALVATALTPFVVWLKSRLDIIKELMPDAMLNKIRDLFDSVKMKFSDIKVSVLEKIDDIKKWFSNLKDDLVKKFEPVVTKFDELKGKLVKKFEPVTNFINSIGELFGKADKASPTLFQRMTKFLSFFDGIFGFFRGFFKGFNFVFRGLFRVLTRIPFIGQIIDFAVGIFKGFQEGLSGLDLFVSGLVQIFAGGIGGTVDLLVDGLNWLLGLFGFDLKKSLGLGEDFSLEEMIRTGLMDLWNFLTVDLFSDDTWRFVGEIFDGIFLDMEYAWNDLKQIVSDFWDGLMLDVEYIWMSITTSLSETFTFLKTKWEEIKKEYGLDTIFNSVSEMFNNFLDLFNGENINKNIEEFKKKFTLDNIFNSITGIFEYLGSLFDPSAFKKTLKSMASTLMPEWAVNKLFGKDDPKTPKPEKSPSGTPDLELDPKKSKELISKATDSGLFIDGWFSDSVDASKLKDASTETLQALLQTDLDSENTKLVKSELENRNQESIRNSMVQQPKNKTSGALDSVQTKSDEIESEIKTKQSSSTSNTVVGPSTQDNSRRSQTINYLSPDKKIFGTSGGNW